ncbi:MAG: hypothetical protein KatS3mg016_1213 [Fimbriimonadales bacterium]|nr:MAG: hypothetical protein KatS3mg016_1213 [Fimbriimonadales bacterium]
MLCVAWGQMALDAPLIILRLVDSDGRPVTQAWVQGNAVLQGDDTIYPLTQPRWQRVSPRGLCVIDGDFVHRQRADEIVQGKLGMKCTLLIHAPGYRPVMLQHEGALPREATVVLQPARTLELRIRDDANRAFDPNREPRGFIAEFYGSPIVIAHESPELLYDVRDLQGNPKRLPPFAAQPLFLSFGIERAAEGVYRAYLPPSLEGDAYVMINAQGQIRGYHRRISPEELERGVMEIRLPKTARVALSVDFQAPAAKEADRAMITFSPTDLGQNLSYYNWMFDETPQLSPQQPRLVISDLAPGDWEVSAWLTKGEWQRVDTVQVRITVPEGGSIEQVLRPEPFDPNQYRGKRTLTLKVQRVGGRPAARLPYRIVLNLWRRGKSATIAQGKLDANGTVRLTNLYELPQDAHDELNYSVYIDNAQRANFTLRAGDGQRELKIVLPPSVNEPAPNITVSDLKTGKPITLQSLRGKWVYLEFWATWCGPCQGAMQALKEAVDKHGARWRGKLEILTVSIDDTREVVMSHLKKNGWENFARHAWDAEGRAATAYGIQAIPTAFLINPNGRVVWTGHPLGEDPATKINRYLQGGGQR